MEIRYVTTRFEFESALAELWTIEKLCCDFETTGLDARVHEPRLLQLCSTKEDEEDRVVMSSIYSNAKTSMGSRLDRVSLDAPFPQRKL